MDKNINQSIHWLTVLILTLSELNVVSYLINTIPHHGTACYYTLLALKLHVCVWTTRRQLHAILAIKSKTIWEEQHILKDRYCFIQLCNCYVCSYQHLPEQKSNGTTTTGGQNSRGSWPVSSVQYYNLAKIEIFIDKQCC